MSDIVVSTPPTLRFPAVNPSHPAGIAAAVTELGAVARAAFPAPLEQARGKTALVLGSTSLGYGAAIAVALEAAGFDRIVGLGYAEPPTVRDGEVRRAAPDWYVTASLHDMLGGKITTYLANAFSDETRERLIGDLEAKGIQVDLVVYSLASPRRTYMGHTWSSAIGVIGDPLEVQSTAVDLKSRKGTLKATTVKSATESEVEGTRRVMGGEDLTLWVSQLLYRGVLNQGATVTALSYIGPEFGPLRRIYWDGALGAAKKDIDVTMKVLGQVLGEQLGGKALSIMAPAIVSRASAVISGLPTYIDLYLGVADAGIGKYLEPVDVGVELTRALYGDGDRWRTLLDDEGRLRLDAAELETAVQTAIQGGWAEAATGAMPALLERGAEIFAEKYLRQYGWSVDGVDYDAPARFDVPLTEAAGVVNLLGADVPSVSADGTARVDAYFGALFARQDSGVERQDGTLNLTARTPREQSALLADITGNRVAHDAGLMAPSIDFAESLTLLFTDAQPELEQAKQKSVIHAQEVISILGKVPLDGTRKRRLKRRAMKAGLIMTNRVAYDESGAIVTAGDTSLVVGADLSQAGDPKTPDPATLGELVGEEPIISRMIDGFVQASGDDNIVHTSRLAARELGLPGRVAHGMLVLALTDKWLHAARPALDPATPRKITTKFTGFVLPEDTVRFYVEDTDAGHKVSVLRDRGDQPAALVLQVTLTLLDDAQVTKIREQKTKQVAAG